MPRDPIFEPDNFSGNPYGYVTNQAAHFKVGFVLLAWGAAYLWFHLTGALPDKLWHGALAAIAYALYELWDQGFNGFDTVEDWWFVVGYGVFAPLTIFTEFPKGSGQLVTHIGTPAIWFAVICVHLSAGAAIRFTRAYGEWLNGKH